MQTNKQLRIYIAGPYTPSNCDLHDAARIAQKNVNNAITIANTIFKKGHYAFVPHLSHYTHIHESNKCKAPKEFWYEYDNTFLERWANALFYIAPSYGADMEKKLAEKLGFPIFYKLEDIPSVTEIIKCQNQSCGKDAEFEVHRTPTNAKIHPDWAIFLCKEHADRVKKWHKKVVLVPIKAD